MNIPIRATFRRAEKRGERATMVSAVYADVPDELIVGQLAQTCADVALSRGDHDGYTRIRQAIDRAEIDGKIITIRK